MPRTRATATVAKKKARRKPPARPAAAEALRDAVERADEPLRSWLRRLLLGEGVK